MAVNVERQDYKNFKERWLRLRDCYEGRDAVLKAGNTYVPDLPGADATGNMAYRKRGNFFNAVKRTVQGMVGAIFQEPPKATFPEAWKEVLDDITLTNIPFEMFAADTGREVLLMGRYGVLIDMPNFLADDKPGPTDGPKRPYVLGYRTEDIINWRTTNIGGDDQLTMIVLKECVVEQGKDEFESTEVEQFRVVRLVGNVCTTQLYREDPNHKGTYLEYQGVKIAMRRGVALDFVPFIFIGATHATPELVVPPLLDLADVNLGHWRNSVDHEWGLHLVSLPTPWVAGAKGATTGTGPMKIGPSVVWELEVQGSAGMLEFAGTGLGALVTAMDEKKKQMASLGARLLEDQPAVGETASAVRMRHAGEYASLKQVAQSVERGFSLVLQVIAWWVGTEAKPVDTKVNVELNKDYLDIKASAQEVQVALTALQAGEMSFETWYNFLATGEWVRQDVDVTQEQKDIAEAKKLSAVPVEDPNMSPPDPAVAAAAAAAATPKKKVIKDANGNTKYSIEG